MRLKYKNRRVDVKVRKLSLIGRFFGLMFRSKKIGNLLFEFRKDTRISLHSLFVFFPFLVVWLDGEDNVIETRIVKPFLLSVKPEKKFRKVVEIPLSGENQDIVERLKI